jgi:hypothetical protein
MHEDPLHLRHADELLALRCQLGERPTCAELIAFSIAAYSGALAGYFAAATGAVFVGAAIALLRGAHRQKASLLQRRQQLERELQAERS